MIAPSASMAFNGVFRNSRVVVTGHTGFKGSWLCEWLLSLGAEVTGYALLPATVPSLFHDLGLATRIQHVNGDVRAAGDVYRVITDAQPDFVFHLAAQPLVRRSYREAAYTWETNVLGTVYVLEALRQLAKPCAVVMVTTDKCYDNREWVYSYRENDPLGGHDPYSSSKAAAELAIASWRNSFFSAGHPVRIVSARAGNVIGGGDWAEDRIVPDAMRALARGESVRVRNPLATRPWQHVLEPTSGYMALAAALRQYPNDTRLASAFNIGPGPDANQPVQRLVEAALDTWPGTWNQVTDRKAAHEATMLQLDSAKIQALIGWRPTWDFREAVERTVTWYRDMTNAPDASTSARTLKDIHAYEATALQRGVAWAGLPSSTPRDTND